MTLRLPDDLSEQLRREAFERHVSQTSIIIEALTAHLGAKPASNVRVTMPTTPTGPSVFTSPEYRRALQEAVQEAVLRYAELNPGNGKPGDDQ
jgi:predicted membrane GTPase involved in stress response